MVKGLKKRGIKNTWEARNGGLGLAGERNEDNKNGTKTTKKDETKVLSLNKSQKPCYKFLFVMLLFIFHLKAVPFDYTYVRIYIYNLNRLKLTSARGC